MTLRIFGRAWKRLSVALAASSVLALVAGCGTTVQTATVNHTLTQTQTITRTVVTAKGTRTIIQHRIHHVYTTRTVTQTITSLPNSGPVKSFSGNGEENVGSFTLDQDSTLTWSCPTCGQDGGEPFAILGSPDDANEIAVDSDGVTQGETVVPAGTYNDVTISTTGNGWTVNISPGVQ